MSNFQPKKVIYYTPKSYRYIGLASPWEKIGDFGGTPKAYRYIGKNREAEGNIFASPKLISGE